MLTDGFRFLEGATNTNLVVPVTTEFGKSGLEANIGEIVFQTDGTKGLYIYNGTAWVLGVDTEAVVSPTTIAGYGITDAYTKTEVNTAISNATPTFSSLTGKPTTLSGYGITDAAVPDDITTAITNIKDSVPEAGNTLKKLHDLIIAGFGEITVADITERDAYEVTHLPTNIFVVDDGDTNWALYKAITIGTNANYVKLSDPDLLNAALGITPENVSNKSIDGTLYDNSDTKYPTQKAVKTYADTKLAKNIDITAGTGTKVTYDAKGLVTSSDSLVALDIPELAISKITNLQTSLDDKLAKNVDITAGTGTKVTYDAKGLVTSSTILGAADIPELEISKITNLQTSLDDKVTKNAVITAGTGTKVTYDAKGLVTAGTSLSLMDLPSEVVYTVGGKIPSNYMPPIAISTTQVISDVSADATNIGTFITNPQVGDIAILTAISKTFIVSTDTPSVVWTELLSPTGGVITANDKTGSAIDLSYVDIDSKSSDIVTAGTYNNVTVNTKGRITGVANAKYAILDTYDKLDAINMPTFTGDVTLNTSTSALTVGKIKGISIPVSTPTDGQVLVYNATTSSFIWTVPTTTDASLLTSGTLDSARLPVLTKTTVGLSNVDNTTDLAKPISTAVQNALNAKAAVATTLIGYGITDAYTKTEVNTAITNATPTFTTLVGKPTTLAGYGITDAPGKAENTFTGAQTATNFISSVATGTAPFTVSSTTAVPNLNVKILNGVVVSDTAPTDVGYALVSTSATAASWTPVAQKSTINTVTNRIADGDGNLRSLPVVAKTAAYTLVAADNGRNINIYVGSTVAITVPAVGTFANGDLFSIYNQSGVNQNLTFPAGYTVYSAGTTTAKLTAAGSIAIKPRGILSVMFTIPNGGTTGNATEVIVSGNI